MKNKGGQKMANVKQWSRTVAINIFFLLNMQLSRKKCIYIFAQHLPNNRRFCLQLATGPLKKKIFNTLPVNSIRTQNRLSVNRKCMLTD